MGDTLGATVAVGGVDGAGGAGAALADVGAAAGEAGALADVFGAGVGGTPALVWSAATDHVPPCTFRPFPVASPGFRSPENRYSGRPPTVTCCDPSSRLIKPNASVVPPGGAGAADAVSGGHALAHAPLQLDCPEPGRSAEKVYSVIPAPSVNALPMTARSATPITGVALDDAAAAVDAGVFAAL